MKIIKLTNYISAFALVLWISACNVTKNVPDNDALYTGATVEIKNSPVGKKQTSVIKSDLQGLTRPKPNSKILGIPFKLSIYNLAGKYNPQKKEKGLRKLIRKYGEPPVLLSQLNLAKNEKVLTSTLENKGFFHASTTGDTIVKAKKAHAVYTVVPGIQYKINEVHFPEDSSKISAAIRNISPKTILIKGNSYNLDVIKGERTRIDIALKEKGFYFFSPDHLIISVDSTIGNGLVNMYVRFKEQVTNTDKQAYTINDIFIYSNYNLNAARKDTVKVDSAFYHGYYVIDRKKTFKPQVFERIMRFKPGDLYNRTDHNLSLSRLINLNTFKFVKNRFEVVPDTFKLNAYYYLTPLAKKSLSLEAGASTKSNNATGSSLTLRWKNRNFFRGAEQFSLSAYIGTEVQYSSQLRGYNIFRTGAEANLSFPRYVVPVLKLNTKGSYVPRTNLQLGYDILTRQTLYALNSFRGQFGYSWKESATKEHTLNPISITFVQPLNVSQQYADSIKLIPLLRRAIEKQFILGSNYTFNYNQLANKTEKNPRGLYFNGNIDLSGNIAGLISGANIKKMDTVKVFGVDFSQYVKTEFDTRYYFKVGQNHQWANRLIIGVGIPYGNSSIIPYIKQFYVGGNNSLRGFRSRSVGPGTFNPITTVTGNKAFYADQTGDIKIELNTEFRAKLYSIFYGALFFDAGNVWLYNSNVDQPGGKFSKEFINELATDVGVGLRIDVSILLIRFDVAFPVSDPRNPRGDRLVIDQFGNREFRKTNTVYNIAIGLPF